MRNFVAVIVSVLFLTTTMAAGGEPAKIESAEQRWATDGQGGSPDYIRHVVPLFSKLGCNNRACHGSFQGQSGFRLSLFGFEPAEDLKEMFEEDEDGLRANVKAPEESLVLFKPTNEDEHEGGQLMEVDSWQYRMFRQWIADGAKYNADASLQIGRFEIQPSEVVANSADAKVALRTIAHFSDGSVEDVTALTVFSSNDESVATVTENGEIAVLRPGDTAVIARYSGGVSSTQVLVPAPDDGQPYPVTFPHNKIDEFVGAKLRKLNIRPSDLCDDADFIRRVSLDVIGRLPTPEATREFLADRSPGKRAKHVDSLLEHPAYATYWGMKFSDWTGNSKYINNKAMLSNWLWQQWIEDKLSRSIPYDEIVYGFVCATSLEDRPRDEFLDEAKTILHKAAGRYNYDDDLIYASRRTNELFWSNVERRNPDTMVLQTANSFLGLRLECAQCHNHPFDRWTQKDFEQFKSFFMMVRFCDPATGEEKKGGGRGYGDESVEPGVTAKYTNTVRKTPPKLLGGAEVPYVENGPDARVELWQWMRERDNPFFAPAFVNRLWHHYFGKGIVDAPDDFNQGNPPSNPQLLDWLAKELIGQKFDIKHVHRLILNSRTYQLSWQPNDSNRLDKRNYSHAQLRRMPASPDLGFTDCLVEAAKDRIEEIGDHPAVTDDHLGGNVHPRRQPHIRWHILQVDGAELHPGTEVAAATLFRRSRKGVRAHIRKSAFDRAMTLERECFYLDPDLVTDAYASDVTRRDLDLQDECGTGCSEGRNRLDFSHD